MFITEMYVKNRFKNWGSPCHFLSSSGRKIKNITKIKHGTVFVYILGFIFDGVSRAKTDLHNKYMIYLVCGSFYEKNFIKNNYFRSFCEK